MNKTFPDLVKEYSNWKLQEKGNGKLTRKELLNLRESFKQMKQPKQDNRSAQLNKILKEHVEMYRAWKKENKGTDKLNEKEISTFKKMILKEEKEGKLRIRENVKQTGKQDWNVYLTNYKKFKESKEGKDAKITYKELKILKENWKEASEKKIRLREADAGFDPAAGAAPMPGDPNAAMGADPMAGDPNAMGGATVDPTVASQIQDLVQSANALAASAGVQVNDLGADPAAGVPPVDGMQQPADPNAAAQAPGAPMMEKMIKDYRSWKKANKGTDKLTEGEVKALKEEFAKKQPAKSKYEQIKERIAAREAKMKGLQEGYLDIPTTQELGTLTSRDRHTSNSANPANNNNPSQIDSVPSPASLAKGYTSGKAAGETKAAKTWPTKAMGKETGGALQGASATQTKVKENESCCDDCTDEDKKKEKVQESKVDKSVKTVTDVYVDRYLNDPKLNFSNLKEAMGKGLLG